MRKWLPIPIPLGALHRKFCHIASTSSTHREEYYDRAALLQDGFQCIHYSAKVDATMARLIQGNFGFRVEDPLFRQYDLIYNHFDYFSPSN